MASIVNTVRDLARLRQILGVLIRHGFGEVVSRSGLGALVSKKSDPPGVSRPPSLAAGVSLGERARLVVTDLGPSFIKLGQILSTRPDMLPAEIVDELKKLQDDVPPVPFADLREFVEGELGMPLSEAFEHFDETALASASIGQVHRARALIEDVPTEVVVKIQRPNIQQTIERDVDLLHFLARTIEQRIPEARVYAPVRMVEQFERAIRAELDFRLEADNAERFQENFGRDPTVLFPQMYRERSSRRVLTMEFIAGKKIQAAVASGYEGRAIARIGLRAMVQQIFEDGFFHADPHPGNLLVVGPTEKPVLVFIDLGLVGRLTPRMRDRTVDLMVAAIRKDYRGLADALFAIGRATKRVDRSAFEGEVAELADKYLGKKLGEIELALLIRDLAYGAQKYGIEVPPDFLMVGKALMTMEGVGKELHPELDVFSELKPHFLSILKQRYSPEKIGTDLVQTAMRLSNVASDVPEQLSQVLEEARRGNLTIQVAPQGLARATDRLGRRVFSGAVVASLFLSGAGLIASNHLAWGLSFVVIGAVWMAGHTFTLRGRPKPERLD